MARKNVGALDDSYKRLIINDFSGGLQLNKGALSLNINEASDILNVIPFPGRLQYRGGWVPYAAFTDGADQAYSFYDSNGDKHFVVWNGGNVEDVVTGAPVNVEAAAYTAGERVGVVDFNGVLYWSTRTVPIRFWDPATATTGAVIATGPSAVPASPLLFLYTNAIVAVGVDFGTGFQENVFSWSGINLPGLWDASNSQAVGPRNGGTLEFGIVFGIAEIGVSPFKNFIIGRSDKGIYGYAGALGALEEFLINVPVGCASGDSVQYIPSADKFGMVIFLGTDGQFYITNGVTAQVISTNVLPLLSTQFASAFSGGASPRFYSGYNEQRQYYFCSVGSFQFVYKWDTGAWSLFTGWPVGPTIVSTDVNGVPVLYTASASVPGTFAQIGVDQALDNGTPPTIKYSVPYLHMGDPEKMKEYGWVALFTYQTGTQYTVTGISMPNCDGEVLMTSTLYFPSNANNGVPTAGGIFTLDSSLLDGPDLLGGFVVPGIVVTGTGTPLVCHGRLSVPAVPTGILAGVLGLTEQLRGGAAQFTIAYNAGVIDFEVVSFEIRFVERGYLRVGNEGANPQSGTPPVFDPYIAPV